LTSIVWGSDAGPGESLYANVVDRPVEVVRFALDGTGVERLASFPQVPDQPRLTIPPDGRITRIPSENLSDYQSVGWTPQGHVMAVKTGLRATLWKFQPAPR
jgi:hypothetical protein